jgi:hypothetical protein
MQQESRNTGQTMRTISSTCITAKPFGVGRWMRMRWIQTDLSATKDPGSFLRTSPSAMLAIPFFNQLLTRNSFTV